MTKKAFKAAVEKYSEQAKQTDRPELKQIIIDEGASEADAEAICAALYKAAHYQEWECKISKVAGEGGKIETKVEKLKISRPCVKITEEEAENLNSGAMNGSNTWVKMYFLPE